MVKPTDSASPHRPIRKESEGLTVRLDAVIVTAGHTSSRIKIGPLEVLIGNAALREASGKYDL